MAAGRRRADADDEAEAQADRRQVRRRDRSAVLVALRIDHVIYAAGDLDSAADRIEAELGVSVKAGGRHEGLGTHNRIVPLGDGYLELLAIADVEEAKASPLGRALADRLAGHGDGLFMWSVEIDNISALAKRLETPVQVVRREGMTAHLTGLGEALAEPLLPFFISREAGTADPGAADTEAGGISWVEVGGDAARLRRWLGGADLPVRVAGGASGVQAIGIGDAEFRTG